MNSTAQLQSRLIARSPFFFGWMVLLAATIGKMMTMPGQTVAISVVIDPLMADLALSRTHLSTLYSIATVAGALFLTPFGQWLDRMGPRVGVVAVTILFALSCFGMSAVTGPWTLFMALFALRGLGQGALGLVSQHVITQWFVRRRGLALGLAGVGLASSTYVFPTALQAMIAAYDWRTAYLVLGAGLLLVMLPLGAGFYRHRPEMYGLVPDGLTPLAAERTPIEESNLSLAEAQRMPVFWVFAAGSTMVPLFATALVFHHFSLAGAHGLDRTTAAAFFLPLAVATAVSNLGAGIATDYLSPRRILVAALAALTGAIALAGVLDSLSVILAYGTLVGLSIGISNALSASVWAHYFGRAHLGSIKGFVQTLAIVGTAIGPISYGLAYDWLGTYQSILRLSAILPLGTLLAALRFAPVGKSTSN